MLHAARGATSSAYRSQAWYESQSIDLLLGISATALDTVARRVALSSGGILAYRALLIATGSRARRFPPLAGYENVSSLRTVDDCRRLREVVGRRARLAVIGAGFIGQEVAATARRAGCAVTMIEAAPVPLHGLLGHRLGTWFAELHRAEGVSVRAGCTVEQVSGNGTVEALCLSDGSRVEVDHVLVGVGVEPDVAWLRSSGLELSGGALRADADGWTQAPAVWAAGDAAATFDPRVGGHLPGSHWEAAARQGALVARAMLGLCRDSSPIASFWTDQYDLRIQYLGHAPLADALEIDGDLDGRSFTATYTRAGRTVAALLVGRPRALPEARQRIEKGTTPR
jgi:NADPH-dependent 2,4-dienoyl-CoA reductase/sulfur reductase-like enzyme